MKKVFIIALMLVCGMANAQNYLHLNIAEIENQQTFDFCTTEYDSVLIEKEQDCNAFSWRVRVNNGESSVFTTDVLTLIPGTDTENYEIEYQSGCGINYRGFYVNFFTFPLHNPWWTDNYIWKREGESITLYGGTDGYSTEWSTGSINDVITVTNPGTYWLHIYNDCGELYDTIQVRDNVEITLATCDLASNLNMVTWQTTPEQAEYVSQVEVKRDGLVVGTVPYTDGQFIDNIGSDAASRTYTVTAIATDGTPCPLTSHPKETIHMSYTLGVNNTIELGWNTPTGYDLIGYNICEWNAVTNVLAVIDFVGAGVTSYTCQESMFDHGNIVVQGVEDGKAESRLLSNRSWETVGLGEHETATFSVYPNPSNGIITVESTDTLTVTNVLGQRIVAKEISGMETIELLQGIYFVKMGDETRKIVVE